MAKTAILSVKILGDAAGAQKSFDAVDTGLDKVSQSAGKMGEKLGVAGVAAGAALTKGLLDAVDADGANRKLAGQLALTPAESERVGAMAGGMFADAYGDSLDEVNAAIGGVSSTLADLSANGGADVERLSKKALDAAGTFDLDLAGAISTAGTLMKTGLAADGDEAFDLLIGSMRKMPQAMQAELLPVMDEYSKHFADLGIDGTTALGIIANASQNGAIGMDKVGDSLKELTIRATDMSPATVAAYDAIGLSTEDMTAKMLAGGDQAQDAFGQIVAGLQNVEDPAAQAQAAVALFGTPLEDLGTAGIPDFLGAIDPMGDAFDSVAGSADALSETINTGPAVAVEEMKRGMLASLQEMAAEALPFLMPVIALLTQFAPILGPAAVAIAAVAAVVKVASTAQMIWNAAMAANPIMLVVIVVAALIAGIILAYNNIGWFKDAVDAAGAVGAAAIQWIVDVVTTAVDWVKSVTVESETFMDILSGLGEIGKSVFGTINDAISGTIGWIQDAIGWFQGLFGAKNDAASVEVDGGGAGSSGSFAAPAAMMQSATVASSMFATDADPMALAYSAPGTAAAASPAAYMDNTISAQDLAARITSAGSDRRPAPRNVTVKVEFTGLVTDKLGVAREIKKILKDADELVGAGD